MRFSGIRHELVSNERGVALAMVLILSAVSLAIMAALVYMLTASVQVTGIQQRYRTALDAAKGGTFVAYRFIDLRGDSAFNGEYESILQNLAMNPEITVDPEACRGVSIYTGLPYKGLQAKLMTPQTSWTDGCFSDPPAPLLDKAYYPYVLIDPANPKSYDISFEIGTYPVYKVFAKIADTVEGNTTGGLGLWMGGAVPPPGEVPVEQRPYIYTVEVHSERKDNPMERVDFSILYEY